MFCAAGSSVGARMVCLDLKAPLLLIVPFQIPIARIAVPETRFADGICVLIEKVHVPAGKPVPPARSWIQPVPVGVELGVPLDVFWTPGLKTKYPVAPLLGTVRVEVLAVVGADVASRHDPESVEAVLDRYSGDG